LAPRSFMQYNPTLFDVLQMNIQVSVTKIPLYNELNLLLGIDMKS
jgi:hypothetical protein